MNEGAPALDGGRRRQLRDPVRPKIEHLTMPALWFIPPVRGGASVRKLLIVLLTGLVILTTAVFRVENINLDNRVAQIKFRVS